MATRKTTAKASPPRKTAKASKAAAKKPAAKAALDSAAEFEALLNQAAKGQRYVLTLYITGSSPRSTQAIANIKALCEQRLQGNYDLEVVDIYQQPDEAQGDQIIAAPTLIKHLPKPARRLVGDMSDQQKVLLSLNLQPGESQAAPIARTRWLKL